MPIAHIMATGMGGMRTAGDLVGWMQMTRRMKIAEAKRYVADKLKVDLIDLTDEDVMHPLRNDLGIGVVTGDPGLRSGITAKAKIAELLDIEINSVNYFKSLL